jgi:hypothetical protein
MISFDPMRFETVAIIFARFPRFSNFSVLLRQNPLPLSHPEGFVAASLRKASPLEVEGCFRGPRTASASQEHDRTPDDAIGSDDLDFMNAAKANLDRKMSYPASVYSFHCQHCLPFQLLGSPRALVGMMKKAPSNVFPTAAIQLEEPKRANREAALSS